LINNNEIIRLYSHLLAGKDYFFAAVGQETTESKDDQEETRGGKDRLRSEK